MSKDDYDLPAPLVNDDNKQSSVQGENKSPSEITSVGPHNDQNETTLAQDAPEQVNDMLIDDITANQLDLDADQDNIAGDSDDVSSDDEVDTRIVGKHRLRRNPQKNVRFKDYYL